MLTRRTMIGGTGAAAALLGAGAAGGQPVGRPPVLIRRSVYGLPAGSTALADYAKAVGVMRARPASDPTSWVFQAAIHGSNGAVPPAFADTWNSCQHGSFFFLSWHRMYLYFFERIVRKASGRATFALPYWDYGPAANRALPPAFRLPATAANQLFVAERDPSINSGAVVPASATLSSAAMATTLFGSPGGSGLGFGGQTMASPVHFSGPPGRIESQPHNVMHGVIGGDTGWMSDPNTAAADPIFWLHHCNIDRLWSRWLASGGGRVNPVGNPAWMTTKFNFFNENGVKVQMSGAQVVNTVTQLRYRYDDVPPPLVLATALEKAAIVPSRVIASRSTEAVLQLGRAASRVTLQPPGGGAEAMVVTGGGPVVLKFAGIALQRPVGLYYEVYVNKPANGATGPESPYYAGNLSFFGLGHRGGSAVDNGQYTLEISDLLAAQRKAGQWRGGEVSVDLVPQAAGGVKPSATESAARPLVTIGEISILGR